MTKKIKPRVIPEQDGRIIGTICLCQLTMVLSGVALVYLSVAVYAPSHRAFHSGFDPKPVMCETVNTTMAKNCTWASCGEWCLTKTSGFCPQIHAAIRENGSALSLTGCTKVQHVECPPVDLEILAKVNCNNETQCGHMSGLFNCSLGHCSNMSEVVQCTNKGEGPHIDVDKDSGKLTGRYECHGTHCMRLKKPIDCERICSRIGTTPATTNVLVESGDGVTGAHCDAASATDPSVPAQPHSPPILWTPGDGVLLVNCYKVKRNGTTIDAIDCINGTMIPHDRLPQPAMNFTQLRILWEKAMVVQTEYHESRGGEGLLPPSQFLSLRNVSSRLYVNLAGCVNTLRGECKQFLDEQGRDGRNHTARSRFPCYYNQNDSLAVLARFDLEQTWRELIVAVLVPAVLFVVSMTTLCIITRSVKVGDDAKLRCLACCSSSAGAILARSESAHT